MHGNQAVCDARHAFLCQVKALLAIHAESIVLLSSDLEMPGARTLARPAAQDPLPKNGNGSKSS
jgi:hypothetical protein